MRKYIKNNDGFGFFLTFLILALGIVISASLFMTVTADSKSTSKNLGNTQAKDLAIKGVESAAYTLNEEIKKSFKGKLQGMSYAEYNELLQEKFKNFSCSKGENKLSSSSGETGDFEVCIDGVPDLYKYGDIDYKSATYKVKFKSTGISKTGETETTYKTMLIGSEGFPEALRFALSTYNKNDKKEKGSGNIYLNGSTEIKGDIKVDNDLIVSTYGTYLSGSRYWFNTGLPSIFPATNNNFAKITVGGDLYKYTPYKNETEDSYYYNHISRSRFDGNLSYSKTNEVNNLFLTNKNENVVRVNREGTRNAIDIEQQIKMGEKSKPTKIKGPLIIDNKESNNWYIFYKSDPKVYSYEKDESRVLVEGNLEIGHPDNKQKANLTVQGDPKTGRGVTFYVKGDVTINNVNLISNMLIYTTGKVTIRESTIQGTNLSSIKNEEIRRLEKGTLIVFSKKDINLANNSQYLNTPSRIKGFFMTEQNIEMYGAGSNVELNGGISANQIVLNTFRAEFPSERRPSSNSYEKYISTEYEPRLKIHYDPYLIEAYLKLYPPEPVFYGPDLPIEFEIGDN